MPHPIDNKHLKQFPRTEMVYVENNRLKLLNNEQLKAVYHQHILFLNDVINAIYANWRDVEEEEKYDVVDVIDLLVKKSEEIQATYNKIK